MWRVFSNLILRDWVFSVRLTFSSLFSEEAMMFVWVTATVIVFGAVADSEQFLLLALPSIDRRQKRKAAKGGLLARNRNSIKRRVMCTIMTIGCQGKSKIKLSTSSLGEVFDDSHARSHALTRTMPAQTNTTGITITEGSTSATAASPRQSTRAAQQEKTSAPFTNSYQKTGVVLAFKKNARFAATGLNRLQSRARQSSLRTPISSCSIPRGNRP